MKKQLWKGFDGLIGDLFADGCSTFQDDLPTMHSAKVVESGQKIHFPQRSKSELATKKAEW